MTKSQARNRKPANVVTDCGAAQNLLPCSDCQEHELAASRSLKPRACVQFWVSASLEQYIFRACSNKNSFSASRFGPSIFVTESMRLATADENISREISPLGTGGPTRFWKTTNAQQGDECHASKILREPQMTNRCAEQ